MFWKFKTGPSIDGPQENKSSALAWPYQAASATDAAASDITTTIAVAAAEAAAAASGEDQREISLISPRAHWPCGTLMISWNDLLLLMEFWKSIGIVLASDAPAFLNRL